MKKLNYLLIVAGIIGVVSVIVVTPEVATRYLSPDQHITSAGLETLRVYTLLALRGGLTLLALGIAFLLLEWTSIQVPGPDNLATRDVVTLAVAAAVIATLVEYRYGSGNHIEQLPIVMRVLDSSYLSNDFFTNANAGFGPRFYFSHVVAFLAGIFPLPFVYLALTLLSNILVAVISGLFARDLFEGSNVAGMLAVCFVMSVETFGLGGTGGSLYANYLVPGALSMPLVLLSVWAGFRQRPLLCSVSAGLASIVHPLLGLETGAIMLFTLGAASIAQRREKETAITDKDGFIRLLIASLLLFAFAALSFVPYRTVTGAIDSTRFVGIVACFRHPHHYCPSTFPRMHYLQFTGFLIALGISWEWWRKAAPHGYLQTQLPILVAVILVLFVGGYVFVERIPSRLFTTAQTFRLVFIIKRLGLIWIAGTTADLLKEREQFNAYLVLVSVFSPITVAISHLAAWARERYARVSASLGRLLEPGPVLVIVVTSLALLGQPSGRVALLFLTFVLLTACLNTHWRSRWHATQLVILATSVWLLVLVGGGVKVPPLRGRLPGFQPVISLSDFRGPDIDLASWARHSTPEDAIFLTPPQFGQFRLVAERAIVVDFKAFPFQDQAILEWQQRLFDCYGIPTTTGFAAAEEMDASYRAIEDAAIQALQSKYSISYAVLYSDTETRFPTLYSNQQYKVVSTR